MWSLAFLLLRSSHLDVSLAQNNDFNSLSLLSYDTCVTNCVYTEVIITENEREGEKETQQEHVCSMEKKQNQSSWILGKYATVLTAVSGWTCFCCFQPQMRDENIKAVVFTKCLLMIIPLYLSLYLYGFWRIVPGGDQQYSDDMFWIHFPWPVILNKPDDNQTKWVA